jgi:hypothetical protein
MRYCEGTFANLPVPLGGGKILIPVYDSSSVKHFNDSRGDADDADGVGSGAIKLIPPARRQRFNSTMRPVCIPPFTKASSKFYARRGGNPSIPLPPARIAVRAFCHGRPKTRQWRSPVSQSERKTFS